MDSISLSELSNRIKTELYQSFPETYWIVAEISEANVNYSGHCYIELIDKEENGNKITSKARATIWAYLYRMIAPYFKDSTGLDLQEGIKILFKATVEYHPIYGLSLNILDIDPTYSLGDYERQKREVIERLINDGIFDLNKSLAIPRIPSKIAVISSAKAAGYQDFCKHIESKSDNFNITHNLYKATMQGDTAQDSIIAALDKIYNSKNNYDVVVIIRGGGSRSDLMCFDNYELATNVAQFPIPIITGIGHEKDESIVDLVANTKLKTPTAVADFICDFFYNEYNYLMELASIVVRSVERRVFSEKNRIDRINSQFLSSSQKQIHNANNQLNKSIYYLKQKVSDKANISTNNLNTYTNTVKTIINKRLALESNGLVNSESKFIYKTKIFISDKRNLINMLSDKADSLNPSIQLQKGYSIVKLGNLTVKSVSQLRENDKIIITLADGKIESNIEKIIKEQ